MAIASATGVAIKMMNEKGLRAESEEFNHENRVRMFMGLDKIFNYFASFHVTNKSGLYRQIFSSSPLIFTQV